jgi:signal recognition particle subunit SRP54
VGEATDALEIFDSRRMAGRVMGMGDIQGLLEKVQAIGEGDTDALAQTLKSKDFTFETLLAQFEQIEKMGPLGKVLEMIPGLGGAMSKLGSAGLDGSEVKKNKAIIQSMTPVERRNPKIIKGSRRRRIALGSGTSIQMVNRLLSQYEKMKPLYKKLLTGKNFDLKSIFGRAGR